VSLRRDLKTDPKKRYINNSVHKTTILLLCTTANEMKRIPPDTGADIFRDEGSSAMSELIEEGGGR